jgi:hypothetical protein
VIGVLITLGVSVGWLGLAGVLCRRLVSDLDPAARLGMLGLIGLGMLGFVTFFVGLIPGGLQWGIAVPIVCAVCGWYALVSNRGDFAKPKLPEGMWLLPAVAIALGFAMALIGVLAPSDPTDWDALAYHLAVPKLWTQAGQIYYIPFIHQSNFPFGVDNLYIWGLSWGGESGAKAFSLAFLLFGALAIFGLTRTKYGEKPGWWAVLAYATVPSVLWEGGSAYIDLAHGLYAGLGILLVAKMLDSGTRRDMALAVILLGFAVASKYTGLQTVLAVCLVVVVAAAISRKSGAGIVSALIIGCVAFAIGSPWLIRNVVNTRNPVYPFLYEQLGARNWDQRRSDIYRNEQQSFGVGRVGNHRDTTAIGHAILGLAYQPGRYVNPQQDRGLGTPLGAIGFAVMAALLLWMFSGRAGPFENAILASLLLSAVMWFFLSQQSRYILTWAIPLASMLGGGVERLKLGKGLAAAAVVQAIVSLFLVSQLRTSLQIHAVAGDVTPDQYRQKTIPFFEASQAINKLGPGTKVALYDEVFGYLLDVPYFWANPGHSTLIPYDSMKDGADFAREMKSIGFTHVYLNTSSKPRDLAIAWVASMGLNGQPAPMDPKQQQGLFDNWETKWMALVADAARRGLLRPVQSFRGGGILFQLT